MAFYVMAAECVQITGTEIVSRVSFSVGIHPNEEEAKKFFYYDVHEKLSVEPGGNKWTIQPVQMRLVSEEMIRMAYAELIKEA